MAELQATYRVEYALNDDDLAVLHRRLMGTHQRRMSFLNVAITWVVLVPLFPFTPFFLHGRATDPDVMIGYGLTAFAGAGFVVHLWRISGRSLREWRKSADVQPLRKRAVLELLPAGIDYRCGETYASIAWRLITSIEVAGERRGTFFWLGERQAIYLPAKAFGTTHEFDCFVEAAQNLREQNVNPAITCSKCGYDMRATPDAGCPECGWRRDTTSSA